MRKTIVIVIALLLLPASIVSGQQEEPAVRVEAKLITEIAQGKAVLSCPGCDLQGANLSGFNLSKANLARANLAGANLSNTRLDDADLSGANLRGANLDGMTCARCDLSGAQLDRNSLKGAKLNDADLQFTNASSAALLAVDDSSPNEPWACGYSDLSKVTKRIHVATKGRDDATCGATPETACLTIAKGIDRCKQDPAGCAVLVGYGEYLLKEALQLATGIDLHGGCFGQSKAKKEWVSLIRAPDGYTAVLSTSNGAKTIQGFEIFGGNSQISSGFSLAVYVTDRLTILNSHIVAGNGNKAYDSSTGGAGKKGGDGSNEKGGTNPGDTPLGCQNAWGGEGASVRTVSVSVSLPTITCNPNCAKSCTGYQGGSGEATGGSGGGRGGDNCAECPASSAGTGVIGNAGSNGTCGVGGAPAALTMGSISGGYWKPDVSYEGQIGKAGGGGGGGGSGGYFAGWCFFVTTARSGGRGGGGGAGGCGGYGGAGGRQGGASMGILVAGGQLTIRDSRITAGRGGDGGKGGDGSKGGAGGSGAAGGGGEGSAGNGGAGGSGGFGGSSGGGGGGNGGPSIGIALAPGTSDPVESNVVYYLGVPGTPGKGGKGGTATVTGGCTGTDGQDGKASSAVAKYKF